MFRCEESKGTFRLQNNTAYKFLPVPFSGIFKHEHGEQFKQWTHIPHIHTNLNSEHTYLLRLHKNANEI